MQELRYLVESQERSTSVGGKFSPLALWHMLVREGMYFCFAVGG